MPQTPHLLQLLEKNFRTRRVKTETAFFPRKVPIWGSLCERCRSFNISVPTRRMLSPIPDRGFQTGNRTTNFGIAATNCQCSPHRTNVVPNSRSWFPNRKSHDQFRICSHKMPILFAKPRAWPQMAILVPKRQIWSANPNLLTRTAGWNHKRTIGQKNTGLGTTTADWAHKIAMRNTQLPVPIKSWDW